MQKCIYFTFLMFWALTSSVFALNNSDHEEIHEIIEHFTNSWNDHQGQGFGDHYAQDANFVNIFGMAFAGKQEIEIRHIKILETFLKDSKFEVINLKLREAKPDVVIAHVYWKVTNVQKPGQATRDEVMQGIFTHVLLKTNDQWEITASQNTLIK